MPPEIQAANRLYAFVCYAHDERKVVVEQIDWLRSQGFDLWFDEAIEAGNRWSEDLARAVEGCAAVLFFLSPTSASSRYCLDEIHFALECGKPIVPVEIEPVTLTPGLRLSLGGTHRLFMHRMLPHEFQEKLASGLRAAMRGSTAWSLQAASGAPPHRQPVDEGRADASSRAALDWRAILVGVLAAAAAFAAIYAA